jgi:hypothetical protein
VTNEDDEIDGGDAGENGKQGKNVPGFGDGIDGAGGLVENDARQMVPRPEWHGLRHQAARHYHHGVALRSAERSQAVQVSVSQR